jgi:hypothetical protein
MQADGFDGDSVRLISCGTGNADGPAADLARHLNVEVKAPTDTVWIHPDGTLTVGPTPDAPAGGWSKTNPSGQMDEVVEDSAKLGDDALERADEAIPAAARPDNPVQAADDARLLDGKQADLDNPPDGYYYSGDPPQPSRYRKVDGDAEYPKLQVEGDPPTYKVVAENDVIPRDGVQLPVENGHWDGEPGNGMWKSDLDEVNAITGNKPIKFEDGYPDLQPYEQGRVGTAEMSEHPSWKGGLQGNSIGDFASADYAFAKQQGGDFLNADGSPCIARVAEYRDANDLTWHHHQDMATMQLVPTDLHNNVPHSGGASLIRKEAYDAAQ